MYGYLIPFVNSQEPIEDNLYLFDSCGPVMDALILALPSYNTAIYDGLGCDKVVILESHDTPEFLGLNIELTRNNFFNLMGVSPTQSSDVILIQREQPHEFYAKKAKIKGSGNTRRNIPNIEDVFKEISIRRECKIVSMEGLSLREQIITFSSAKIVIMQHGAAMANLIWCEKGAFVIEMGVEDKSNYYKKLIRMAGLFHIHVPQDHDHSPVEPLAVVAALKKTLML